MRNFITIALFVFTFGLTVACTKEEVKEKVCDTGKLATAVVAAQITVEMTCQNTAAIKATLDEKLASMKVCEVKEEPVQEGTVALGAKSVVGDTLCGPLVEGLFVGGISQIPKEWGCTGGPLATEAKTKLIEACKKAL